MREPGIPNCPEPAKKNIGETFNPYKLFTGSLIPQAICRYKGISAGAKLVYGRLARYAGENGKCYPAVSTIAAEIGVGSSQARGYLRELEASGLISSAVKPGRANVYEFKWHAAFEGDSGSQRKRPPQRKTGGVPQRKTVAERESCTESHHQESQKESQDERSLRFVEKPTPVQAEPNSSLKSDDETPTTPEKEFLLRLEFRHKGNIHVVPQHVLREVKHELEKGGISLEEFLARDSTKTLNPKALTNPAGYYRRLAQLLVKDQLNEWRERYAATVIRGTTVVDEPKAERCSKCGGAGYVAKNQHCDCPMGRDLERVDRRRAAAGEATPIPPQAETNSACLELVR